MTDTYGQIWDQYVAKAFPKLQKERDGGLSYPGEEWGSEASWNAIFDHLFIPSDVKNWRYAIEIGGGGGKYTERVLETNEQVQVWGFDVSRNFLDAMAQRLSQHVKTNRLVLNEIDGVHPDGMLRRFEKEGLVRKVDAMFSIDAMVHVDLQYLVTYWINAALVLKPGGRILMTLADATSQVGFQKLIRDIKKFYKFQGRMCPKFEYLDRNIVSHVLTNLGFEIDYLEQWAFRPGASPRDLYLIARLDRVEQAENFRAAITTGVPALTPSPPNGRTRAASKPAPARQEGQKAKADAVTQDQREAAQSIGKAYWRALILQNNPNITKEQLREELKQSWGGSRREYDRLGMLVLRQLETMGYTVRKDGDSAA